MSDVAVSEIFLSLQGESAQSGRLCSFVRLFGCNLRCVWCDTKYAYGDDAAGTGTPPSSMSVPAVITAVENLYSGSGDGSAAEKENRLVEITGGEPLLQPEETAALCSGLLALGYEVMVETNGSLDIGVLPPGVRRVVDVKCPGSGSGAAGSFLTDNIDRICPTDELKFVPASLDDAVWAAEFCARHGLAGRRCPIIFSPASPSLPIEALADWMVKTRPDGVRLGIQLHKLVWGDRRGV
jgi:7-carboxy-7-deazaguanine synthase